MIEHPAHPTRPPLAIITYPQRLTASQRAAIVQQWRDAHAGAQNAHRAVVLDGGARVEFQPQPDACDYCGGARIEGNGTCGGCGAPRVVVRDR